MSMNRFVGLGIFALSSSVFVTLAACDDSTAAGPIQTAQGGSGQQQTSSTGDKPSGGESSTDKTSAANKGGNTSTTKKTTTAKGGTSAKTTTKGGEEGGTSGDTTDTGTPEGGEGGGEGGEGGGGTVTPAECTLGETDLMEIAAATENGNWVGSDDKTHDDDPCGIQGAIYAYGDKGVDDVASTTEDNSLQVPALVSGSDTEYESPCKDGKCCIKGKTNLYPKEGSTTKYTCWGAGLGFTLNGEGADAGGGKNAYAGDARGFKITLDGTLNGQSIRIGYTQSATDVSAPFVTTTTIGEKTVLFADPTCPAWATDCIDPGDTPYDVQVQVVGGDAKMDGDFEVCITKLVPIPAE